MQLLSGLTVSQFNLFKRRMQQCIFATDMAKHIEDIKNLKALIEEIPAGAPILTDGLSPDDVEKRRKGLLQLTLHASDISFLTRPWHAQKLQAY